VRLAEDFVAITLVVDGVRVFFRVILVAYIR
jgi:hypothetical protein